MLYGSRGRGSVLSGKGIGVGSSGYVGRVGALAVALGVGGMLGSPSGLVWADTGESEPGNEQSAQSEKFADVRGGHPDPKGGPGQLPGDSPRVSVPVDEPQVDDDVDGAVANDVDDADDVETDLPDDVDEALELEVDQIDEVETKVAEGGAGEGVDRAGFRGEKLVSALGGVDEPSDGDGVQAPVNTAAFGTVDVGGSSPEAVAVFEPSSPPQVSIDVEVSSPPGSSPLGLVFAPIRAVVLGVLGVFGFSPAPGAPSTNPAFEAIWGLYRRIESMFVNQAPAVGTPTITGELVDAALVLTGSLGFVDADFDALSYAVSGAQHGTVTIDADGSFTYLPGASFEGVDSFTVVAGDGTNSVGGAVGATTALVTVTVQPEPGPQPPALAGGGNISGPSGSSLTLLPTITVADTDSTHLIGATVTITTGRQDGADVLALVPNAQNGIVGSYDAAAGILTLTGTSSVANYEAALRSITFTNTSGEPLQGARTVTVTVTDGELTSNTISLTATVRVNTDPVAGNDAFTGTEDTPLKRNVLDNDTDIDPDVLTAILGTGPSNGIVALESDGWFTYTPSVNFHGTDSFTYIISDGHVTSGVATVTITLTPVDDVLFVFSYVSGEEYWTPEAKAALQEAADQVSELIATPSPVTLTFDVYGEYDPSAEHLARGGSNIGIPTTGTGYYNYFVSKVTSVTHHDENGSAADGNIYWNFSYNYSYDDTPAFDEYDFQSVALHEIMHSFGFHSGLRSEVLTRTTWLTYDDFIVDQTGAKVIGTDYRFNTAYSENLSGSNGGLYFGGANAVAAYGGPVPLQLFSLSHLRQSVFSGNVMSPNIMPGTFKRTLSVVELAMLMDLGYTVAGTSPTTAAVAALA